MNVPFEISIQNYFWDGSELETPLTGESPSVEIDCPLNETEWENWFQIWLEQLYSYLPTASS